MALELETDRAFQEKWWILERVAWLIMFAIVLAALLGLTGRGGPLATAQVNAGDRKIVYPRVARWQTASEMSVEFPAGRGGKGEILIPSPFASRFSVESVVPEPSSVTAAPEGILYQFDLEGGAKPARALFGLRAVKPSLWTTSRPRHPAAPDTMSFIILP